MAVEIEKFQEKLDKLRRNEEQMTPLQKKQYAKNLQAFKKQISAEAEELLRDFFFGGIIVLKEDEQAGDEIVQKAKQIVESRWGKDQLKQASRALFRNYSAHDFLEAACRLWTEIEFKAYGPYWVSKTWRDHKKGAYRNPLPDAIWGVPFYWKDEWHEWVADDLSSVTVMLPPTKELLEESYKKEVEMYECKSDSAGS